ncbi:phage capsid protein [Kaistia sp. MMO-174]|uniref:phage capsid protein n=1 Tax=Kaistia sp. MMO-174 TaxID=3081256 RepID=UPI003019276C
MSAEAPAWFVEQYNATVIHKYQSRGFLLKGTVMPEGRLDGKKVYFPVSGKGKARKKVRGQQAVPMNPGRTNVEATLETWEAFDEVWTYDLSRMSANEREAIAVTGGNALGRATDGELIGKFNSAAPTSGTGFINKNSAAFTLPDAMTMCQRLQAQDVPWDGNVFCPLPSLFWNQLMSWKQFNSSDYVGQDLPFTKVTTAKSWNGVHWFLAPDEYFPIPAANQFDIFLYHRSAFGWANNTELQTIWDWDNRAGCWTVRMESEGAAAALLPEGVVRGRFASNSDITAN